VHRLQAEVAGVPRIWVEAAPVVPYLDDDGVGLESTAGYATGAQLGLRLCRRLVERCGGMLELRPRAVRGTRAVIAVSGAPS